MPTDLDLIAIGVDFSTRIRIHPIWAIIAGIIAVMAVIALRRYRGKMPWRR